VFALTFIAVATNQRLPSHSGFVPLPELLPWA
jgi:hypothetical protein